MLRKTALCLCLTKCCFHCIAGVKFPLISATGVQRVFYNSSPVVCCSFCCSPTTVNHNYPAGAKRPGGKVQMSESLRSVCTSSFCRSGIGFVISSSKHGSNYVFKMWSLQARFIAPSLSANKAYCGSTPVSHPLVPFRQTALKVRG